MVKTKTTLYFEELLWQKAKIYCIKNKHKNISDWVESLIEKELRNDDDKEVTKTEGSGKKSKHTISR